MVVPISEAILLLDSETLTSDTVFSILTTVAYYGAFEDRDQSRQLLIRTLDRRNEIPSELQGMLQALIREHGLFPYLRDVVELPIADRLAYEVHRPSANFAGNVVFHSEQAIVYERLLAGENVVLSAPTSFGKSLVIDAILAARDFTNAAVVVPTVALMDECRRRLSRLGDRYKVITHGTQRLASRNLFVMTQERLLEMNNVPTLDFFAIDEFYKLDPSHSDERSDQLNIVFRQLLATGAQFYLLGPNITGLTDPTSRSLRATFIETGFTTVVTDVERVNVSKEQLPDALARECRQAGPETLVFCRSPQRTREVAAWLIERDVGQSTELNDAADWIARTYHPDWLVGRALRRGIGIHHGQLPRAIGHHMVRLFNERRLPYLLVTSTLIEGVNTSARNVLILDNIIANKKYDYFTFANIRGRSGRMSRHYIGRVVVFNPTPQPADLTVDVPSLTQSTLVSDQILLQLPEAELTEKSRRQLAPYFEQDVVDVDTIRQNKGLSPKRQLDAAQQLASDPRRWHTALRWRNAYPTTRQMRELGELLFALTGPGRGVRTANQLGARVNMLRHHRGDLRALFQQDIDRGTAIDVAIESAFDFARNWAQFKIPTALTGMTALADDVLGRAGLSTTNTAVFAGDLENLFLPPYTTVLEEYGLPASLTVKLASVLGLRQARSLDDVLSRLRTLDPDSIFLDPFEREMLADTKQGL